MNEEIKSYLKTMCQEIRSKQKRTQAYKEIRAHLLDRISELKKQNLTTAQATQNVLSRATPAKALGKSLNIASRPWYWRNPVLTIAFGTTVLSFMTLIVASHLLVEHYFFPILKQHNVSKSKLIEMFSEDLNTLAKSPIFKDITFEREASQFLKDKIATVDGERTEENLKIKNLFLTNKGWTQDASLILQSNAESKQDLAWIEELKNYDHLNIFGSQEFLQGLKRVSTQSGYKKVQFWSMSSIPDLNELRYTTLLYTLQRASQGEGLKGLEALRHVAQLFHSSRLLIGQLLAQVLLIHEHDIVQLYNIKGWKLIDMNIIKAYKRVSWGWNDILSLGADPKNFETFKDFIKPNFGVCASVVESPISFAIFSDFFEPRTIFESNFKPMIALEKLRRSELFEICGFRQLRPLLLRGKVTSIWEGNRDLWAMTPDLHIKPTGFAAFLSSFLPNLSLSQYIPSPQYIPYVRRIFGGLLLTIAMPNYMGIYERKLEKMEKDSREK